MPTASPRTKPLGLFQGKPAPGLYDHLRGVQTIHQHDLADGCGRVDLAHALARKYPNASRRWRWQWVFPQEPRWGSARAGEQGRHHLHEFLVQKAVSQAVPNAKLTKRVTSHTLRHSFAAHLLARRVRHSPGPGVARSQGREDDDGIHPRAESRGRRGAERRGRAMIGQTASVLYGNRITPPDKWA